jgi:hypothetical protein
MTDSLPINIIVGAAELPLLFILIALGLTAYLKRKNTAVKYAIIAFPVIMFMNFLALIVAEIFPHNDSVQNLFGRANVILTILVFMICLAALEMAVRWYIKNKGPVVLCLVVSFGLYTLSSLLIFLDTYFFIYGNAVSLAALIIGVIAYLAGISAMILALVRPKPRQAMTPQ